MLLTSVFVVPARILLVFGLCFSVTKNAGKRAGLARACCVVELKGGTGYAFDFFGGGGEHVIEFAHGGKKAPRLAGRGAGGGFYF